MRGISFLIVASVQELLQRHVSEQGGSSSALRKSPPILRKPRSGLRQLNLKENLRGRGFKRTAVIFAPVKEGVNCANGNRKTDAN